MTMLGMTSISQAIFGLVLIAVTAICVAPYVYDSRIKHTITLTEAPGLTVGCAVRKSGVKIGEVTAIDVDNDTNEVRVQVALSNKHPLKDSDDAVVMRDGFAVTLDLLAKPVARKAEPMPPPVAVPDQQIVTVMKKVDEAIQKLDAPKPMADDETKLAMQELRDFLKSAKPFVDNLDKLMKANEQDINRSVKAVRVASENIADLLNDDNRKAFAATIRSLNVASDDLGKTLRAIYLVSDLAERTLKNINDRVTTAEKVMGNLTSALAKLEVAVKPIGDNADSMMKNVSMAAEQLAKTMSDARGTLANFNRSEASLNKLLTDPVLLGQLQASATSLNRTLMQAERVMQDLQVFSDKIARRPELIGVGGALRPSNGVKDMPSSGGQVLPPTFLEVPSYRPSTPIPPTKNDLPP